MQSITSALEQDHADFEVIVVNNASTDRTEEIAGGFSNVAVVNEPRKGLLWAREAGRLAATGELPLTREAFEAVLAQKMSSDKVDINLSAFDTGVGMIKK